MSGRQIFELLARLPARVWLQIVVGIVGFTVLAVLGFALIAGMAAVALLAVFALKARAWLQGLLGERDRGGPPARRGPKVVDVTYEIVERRDDGRR
ncbi:hypothetical protein [Enhydrobacter aerosaccus]|uniref:hypothetical protein n=1 Tax=Enhydrobacter aerosaccus TaxID=225324 RepID=UPI000A2F0952|nr:hypothetical protein [Enhydrobacter aerosaccus]